MSDDNMSEAEEALSAQSQAIPAVRRFRETAEGYRWDDVPLLEYKPTGTHFKDITRQILFGEEAELPTELRYFEMAAGGHSTLEKHLHVHSVLILRGRGQVLVGEAITDIGAFDLIYVPPLTWHQFHAAEDEPLGFLCLVMCDRDKPIRPDGHDLALLRAHPKVGAFVRV
jgi:mannose-6-phosphate isomerase-like protein (cupin superfamily)